MEEIEQAAQIEKPTTQQKVRAANVIAVIGARHAGEKMKMILMWPVTDYSDASVDMEAFNFLSDVHIALLEASPLPLMSQISKAQADRLERLFQ